MFPSINTIEKGRDEVKLVTEPLWPVVYVKLTA